MYSVISLFSGCGGLDLGFSGGFRVFGKQYSKLNFDIIFSNDNDKHACLTYEKNFKKPIICADVRTIYDQLPESIDVVCGGFPCQDFSVSGKRLGLKSDRGTLYKSMLKVVDITRPSIFLAENVKGLLSISGAIDTIKRDFESLGYYVKYKLLHVADYGIPQNRERVIIIGTLNNSIEFEYPEVLNAKRMTAGDAIRDLENVDEGQMPNHFWSKAKLCLGTQGNKAIFENKISPTIRAEHHGNIEYHWNNTRRLSAREVARIQTFPDNFIFYPSTSQAYRQIGNAVPPVLGWYLGKQVEKYLRKWSIK